MLKNYFTIAYRNIIKHKLYSFINISGLAVGIACCVLIILFIKDELTFDHFHTKADRIYRAMVFEDYGEGEQFLNTVTPLPLAGALEANFPEVEATVKIYNFNDLVKRKNQESFNENILMVGDKFFNVFDFELLHGATGKALSGQDNMVLTSKAAIKYFGYKDPVGEVLSLRMGEDFKDFIITGVAENTPSNSSINFDFLISDANEKFIFSERFFNSWGNVFSETYVLLDEGADVDQLKAKFPLMIKKVFGEDYMEGMYTVDLQPLKDIHLNTALPAGIVPVNNPVYIYILSGIALLLISIATINFTTLAIGRSVTRAKEVGVRKTLGASRKKLMRQFLTEALLITLVALIVGIVLAEIFLPTFNQLAAKQLLIEYTPFNILLFVMLWLIIGLVAGSYPAMVLSAFKPVKVLKNDLKLGLGRQNLRKGLVALQFVLSILLISCTLIMHQQLNYIQNRHLGFEKELVLVVPTNAPNKDKLSELITHGFEKARLLKNTLSSDAAFSNIGLSSETFGEGNWMNLGFRGPSGKMYYFNYNTVDADFLGTLDLELISGRDFSKDSPSDYNRAIIINEAMAKNMGWDNPVGKRLTGEQFEDHEVIGVVGNFNYASLHEEVEPLVLSMNPKIVFKGINTISINTDISPKLFIKITNGALTEKISKIEESWNKVFPGEPFSYSFLDESIASQYEREKRLGRIVTISTIIAVIIAAMGLFGLASLTIAGKVKEIGIRKVMGASAGAITFMLSMEFVKLTVIAVLVAAPVSYFLMRDWLSNFEYKIDISPFIFLLSGIVGLVITLLTVCYQTIRAALANPVKSLKSE